ncbi:glycosyltransferase family 24 protein [Hygrophoropsis aurantiaca]|uniref:Glycosyltransferase family 24 protein n=1 Tax=Hygrophoropsis aurantiaca TaxID=72124 RepID=A0ACB7ZXY0_9AGAM|nr:glycosyltransferase family 24 protein [Hygrophoropsis aurantiaca]
MAPSHLLAIASCILASLSLTKAHGASPPVKVSLRSSFAAPNPLLEVLETISLEDPSVFFPLLSKFPLSQHPNTPQSAHTGVLEVASSLLETPALASINTLLALHAASPRLAASAEYYNALTTSMNEGGVALKQGCESWVDWYGEVVCDADTLRRLASSIDSSRPKPKRLPFDHAYPLPPSLESPRYAAILYADPTSPGFASLHATLLSLQPQIEYILRWAGGATEDNKGSLTSYLTGYGVSLDLKKMDYLALDDRNGQGNAAKSDSSRSASDEKDIVEKDVLACIFDSMPHIDARAEEKARTNEPLSKEEIAVLGLQATQFLATFSDAEHQCWPNTQLPPVASLLHSFSNSLPQYLTSLSRKIKLSEGLMDEVYENWAKAAPGVNMVWANGKVLAETDGSGGTIYGLLRTLRRERAIVRSLVDLGLTREQAIELLMHPAHTAAPSKPKSESPTAKGSARGSAKRFATEPESVESEVEKDTENRGEFIVPPKWADALDGLIDASDRPEGGELVLWWNDLENDRRYSRFPASLQILLRTHPAQLFSPLLQLRMNLINVIIVLDLSDPQSLVFLGNQVENVINRGFPLRWGLVPAVESVEGAKMARLTYYIAENYGQARLSGFIRDIASAHVQLKSTTLLWPVIRQFFTSLEATDDLDAIIGGILDAPKANEILENARKYGRRLGVTSTEGSSQGHAFVNGKYFEINDMFLREIQTEVPTQLQFLQEMVYLGEITDEDTPTISTFFYDLPGTSSRRNAYIYASNPAAGGHALAASSLRVFNIPELATRTGFNVGPGAFVTPVGEDSIPISMYVIGDLESVSGRELAKEALQFVASSSESRVTFIHNPVDVSKVAELSHPASQITRLVSSGNLAKNTPGQLILALGFTDESNGEAAQATFAQELNFGETSDDITDPGPAFTQSTQLLMRELGLAPGARAILVNGRLVGPFDASSDFVARDFQTLEEYEMKKRVGRVVEALGGVMDDIDDLNSSEYSHLVHVASSIIAAIQQPDPSEAGLFDSASKPRTQNYRYLSGNYTKFEIGNKASALSHIAILLDPLSEAAQRWSSILNIWPDIFPDVFVELYINPSQHTEIPLKRFYRYNVAARLMYDENGQEIPAQVTFNGLPEEPIYTLGMDVPPSWLVRPREALYDLDNIQLGTLSPEDRENGLHALFALDYIVIEGHAREENTNNPPRGVQLQLTTSTDPTPIDDTQVVLNLGYLQFKAKPGIFQLEIREGRSRDVFEMESVGGEGWNSPTVAEIGNELTVMSFEGLTIYPRMTRKSGMEEVDVLEDLVEVSKPHSVIDDIVSRVTSLFKPKDNIATDLVAKGDGQADINIFTVASGLLYERFVSIMIVSVLRNTKSSVKFWFIENFLSPTFLEFIPHMAAEYGFQYELVTYKWPSWLRAQKEKQRIIWAYKILFLDVLFPMDLKKVIFVDADQIVRADLQELVDLDLHGAPYGYTPMGDDNYDMEGFRFWKTGYWKDFLAGRPYHISALYVVDLVRFRQMAAGDILRGQYQALSADPNSLANLDQDLPNNIQRDVPIYSLHEDWLWCETWCSKDRLHRAKTIDLCQNPLTKEPKLSRARQIPEWEEYDSEIAHFTRKLAEDGKIRSSVATADTNVLANVGLSSSPEKDEAEVKAAEADTSSGSETGQQHDEL